MIVDTVDILSKDLDICEYIIIISSLLWIYHVHKSKSLKAFYYGKYIVIFRIKNIQLCQLPEIPNG